MTSTLSKNRAPPRNSHLVADLTGHPELLADVVDEASEAESLLEGLLAFGARETLRCLGVSNIERA